VTRAVRALLVIGDGGGGAEGLQVGPGEAGGEAGEFALDDGLEFDGAGEGFHVQQDFVDGGGRLAPLTTNECTATIGTWIANT
jgi:hypothetical protein